MPHTPNLTRVAPRLVAIILFVALLSAAVVPSFEAAAAPLAATSPTLGAAASYNVLAGSIVTNTGLSTISGDVGVSPSIGVPPHVTGFPLGIVGPPGAIHDADAHAAAAQADNTVAFGALTAGTNATCTQDFGNVVTDLSGMSLPAGVYCTDVTGTTGAFTLSGTLTLVGSGVWIFRSGSTLITSGTANVVGGDPCNVWWRVPSSATLGTNTSLIGNILASTSISLATGARLNGRALTQTGAVTLDTNAISGPLCAPTATATSTPTDTPTSTPTDTPTSTPTDTPTNTPLPPPTNTPLPPPTNTPLPPPTNTPLPPLTATQAAVLTATQVAVLTATNLPALTATEVAVATQVAALTATAITPPVVGLPNTGGAPPRREDFLWSAALAASVVGAMALGLGVRARRRARQARR